MNATELEEQRFELYLRQRMQQAKTYLAANGFPENHVTIEFGYSGSDKGRWSITCGTTYNDYKNAKGELLMQTAYDVVHIHNLAGNNKLKMLTEELPVPQLTVAAQLNDEIPF